MERQYVSSSNIASIGYDPDNQVLEIEFLSGAVYQYCDPSYPLAVKQNQYYLHVPPPTGSAISECPGKVVNKFVCPAIKPI